MNLNFLSTFSANIALFAFALTSLLYLKRGRLKAKKTSMGYPVWLFSTATCATSLSLLFSIFTGEQGGIPTGLLLTASIGWLTLGGHYVLKFETLTPMIAPVATLLLLIHFFASQIGIVPIPSAAPNTLVQFHISTSVIGEAFAILTFIIALFYLWQRRSLKKRDISSFTSQLPALDKLDRLLNLSLWSGFIFLTIGLLSGALCAQYESFQVKDTPHLWLTGMGLKISWSISVWIWNLVPLMAKNIFDRSGRFVALASLGGFIILSSSLFGMVFFSLSES